MLRQSAAVYCVLVASVLSRMPAAGESDDRTVLLQDGFEKGLEGWDKEGDVAVVTEQPHQGEKAARITVQDKPSYQKIARMVDVKASAGDWYSATMWARTSGVSANPGAYVAFEFYAGEKRIDVAHGGMATDATSRNWTQLTLDGTAPAGATRVRLALLLHATGSVWYDDVEVACVRNKPAPEKPAGTCVIRVDGNQIIHPGFGGVGFHCSEHEHTITKDHWDQVLAKRWRELRPSFARVSDFSDATKAKRDQQANYILMMKDVGTAVYVTTWNPKDVPAGPERLAYAKKVVDYLEYLVRTKGCSNLKYYCMTNELSLKQWGALRNDLPTFQSYHKALYDELAARKLEIQLLATDASPVDFWPTIEWATKNMDDITGIYGGHHYINGHALDDLKFYDWFLAKTAWAAGLARAKNNKNFILGEFGSKQDGRQVNGISMDRCVYYETPQEPRAALQVCEAALAAMNGGVHALGYWTFSDYPDEYNKKYQNKWGAFRWSKNDYSTRAVYYSYGLLTRFFRGPATVFNATSSDALLRTVAVQHQGAKTFSIAVLNRYKGSAPVTVALPNAPAGAVFRKYAFDTAHVPAHPFGDMQAPEGKLTMKDGVIADTVAPLSLTVYTTACDDTPPAPVKGIKTEAVPEGGNRIAWQASADADFCYYRIHRVAKPDFVPAAANQIGSTIATEFVDANAATGETQYKVLAVDQSGNASKP